MGDFRLRTITTRQLAVLGVLSAGEKTKGECAAAMELGGMTNLGLDKVQRVIGQLKRRKLVKNSEHGGNRYCLTDEAREIAGLFVATLETCTRKSGYRYSAGMVWRWYE